MYNVLLIEDDVDLQEIVIDTLKSNCIVTCALGIHAAKEFIGRERFDLLILDIGLPDGNGFHFFESLKASNEFKGLPIIFLTGRVAIEDKVRAFNLGADDYIQKPFDLREFRARALARIEKNFSSKQSGDQIEYGNLCFHISQQRVFIQSEKERILLDLTPFEFKLLLYFANRKGETLSRQILIQEIWGDDIHVLPRTVDTHVSHLRKKIEISDCSIESKYGSGYRFVVKPPSAAAAL